MGRKFKFICDGCGAEHERNSCELPSVWADVSVVITGYTNWRSGGSTEQRFSTLLCASCQIQLRERCDPRQWPRGATSEAS